MGNGRPIPARDLKPQDKTTQAEERLSLRPTDVNLWQRMEVYNTSAHINLSFSRQLLT
jgi:hypothetical protein